MQSNKIYSIVLAGENKDEYKKEEIRDKLKMNKKYETSFLYSDNKLSRYLNNDKTILENTLESIVNSEIIDENNIFVIGDKNKLKNLDYNVNILEQKGNSLSNNLKQSINEVYSNNYEKRTIIFTGDIPSINSSDIDEFYNKSIKKNYNKDIIFGMTDLNEMNLFYNRYFKDKNIKKQKKFGINFKDNNSKYKRSNPKLAFGNTVIINKNVYNNINELERKFDELSSMKRVFNDSKNYEKICKIIQDDNKIKENYPSNLLELLTFSLLKSSFLRRLLLGNIILKGNINYSIDISNLEELVQNKLLDNKVSFSISRTPPEFGFDVDDENDFKIANNLISNKSYREITKKFFSLT